MKRPIDCIIGINLLGVAMVTALEQWRPGAISAAVPLWVVWTMPTLFVTLALLLDRPESNR